MPAIRRSGVRPQVWQLHEAKARFSELFRAVIDDGPQRVTKQGGEAVVLVPAGEYDRLTMRNTQPISLAAFFQSAPTPGRGLLIPRRTDTTRDIDW